jgi:hypothetical protein
MCKYTIEDRLPQPREFVGRVSMPGDAVRTFWVEGPPQLVT